MGVIVPIRRLLARRPWIYWCVVAIVFASAVLSARSWAHRVDVERASWGDTVDVLVATTDIEPGDPLGGSVEAATYPLALVPARAVAADEPDVASAISRQHLAQGEMLTDSDWAPVRALNSLIPEGWLAIAVHEAVPGGAQVGDRVVVTTEGVVLADHAIVVRTNGDVVHIAVPERQAPPIAAATTSGGIALLLRP